jgi:hypothetical protein
MIFLTSDPEPPDMAHELTTGCIVMLQRSQAQVDQVVGNILQGQYRDPNAVKQDALIAMKDLQTAIVKCGYPY